MVSVTEGDEPVLVEEDESTPGVVEGTTILAQVRAPTVTLAEVRRLYRTVRITPTDMLLIE